MWPHHLSFRDTHNIDRIIISFIRSSFLFLVVEFIQFIGNNAIITLFVSSSISCDPKLFVFVNDFSLICRICFFGELGINAPITEMLQPVKY